MRLNQILAVSLLGLSLFSFQTESLATEVHFIEVFVPLLVPQEGLVVKKVIFQTEYSTPESEIMATCWPYVVNSVPNEKTLRGYGSENLNVASLSNFKIISSPSGAKDEKKIVVLDVSRMTGLSKDLQERMMPCTKMEILETTVKALEQNLKITKIQNCLVSYAGKELHSEIDWGKLPKILNVVHSHESLPEPYVQIKTKEIFSALITRDKGDQVYSGQINSENGLADFKKIYGIERGFLPVDFKKQMLIFGITDSISSRAFQFLKQEKMRFFILDYAEIGIRYKLKVPENGKKYSYLQVFLLDRIDGISHIQVKNLVANGLSKMYE